MFSFVKYSEQYLAQRKDYRNISTKLLSEGNHLVKCLFKKSSYQFFSTLHT